MELTFVKNNETRSWECEFQTPSDFNLHIEGVPEGKVYVYQRTTASGEYAYVKDATPYPSLNKVYDADFSAVVYPKYIKVVCAEQPTNATVTTKA